MLDIARGQVKEARVAVLFVQDLLNVELGEGQCVEGVDGFLLLDEVEDAVVDYRDHPLQIVYRHLLVPSEGEQQVLEIKKHNLGLLFELGVKTLDGLHAFLFHLERVDLGCRHDSLLWLLIIHLLHVFLNFKKGQLVGQ